jgi:predicted ATPase/class 3 adenylate cyclase
VRQLPHGRVTFLFTDIEGSTSLLHELGPGYAEALGRHRRALRDAFEGHGGVEVDTQGDAFFVAFADPAEAVAAATEAQAALADGPISVRMGLHTGAPELTDEGYVGLDVHLGARVAAAGHGGQVLLTQATRHAVDVDVVDLGEHRVKDFADPVWVFQLPAEESFPPLKTISNTNLPRPASSFVGRERERADVVALVREARLVTLTGPGGSGKTRLAIEAAAELVPEHRNGVFWVGLAALRDPALVLDAVAEVLGAKGDVAEHIGERELLLLLDNLEQVIDAAAQLAALVESCPNLRLLATSRELLQVRGEVSYAVDPLADGDALDLFRERSGLAPDAAMIELCRRLDGLPLAIELAAARTVALSPREVLERLSDRLDLLRGGRDAVPRHRTLRATIDWSYDLLSVEEQRVFARLAVFSGGCTLEAAEAVTSAGLDSLQSLVEKSLLRRVGERFWMYETIRELAGERLDENVERELVARRHTTWLAALVERLELPVRHGEPEATSRLSAEIDNLRSGLEWLALQGDVGEAFRILDGLWYFWVAKGFATEGLRWARWSVLEAPKAPPKERALGLLNASELFRSFGQPSDGLRLKLELLPTLRELSPERHFPATLADAAEMLSEAGDFEQARRLGNEAVAWRRRLGTRSGINHALSNLAMVEFRAGDFAVAQSLSEEALELVEEPFVPTNALYSALLAGESARRAGDRPSAHRFLLRAIGLCRELDQRGVLPELLQEAAATGTGSADSVRILGASQRLVSELGVPRWDIADYERTVRALREQLGDAAFEEAWREGEALQADAALRLAAGCLD